MPATQGSRHVHDTARLHDRLALMVANCPFARDAEHLLRAASESATCDVTNSQQATSTGNYAELVELEDPIELAELDEL